VGIGKTESNFIKTEAKMENLNARQLSQNQIAIDNGNQTTYVKVGSNGVVTGRQYGSGAEYIIHPNTSVLFGNTLISNAGNILGNSNPLFP
jgi:hypothetical protein